jgi:iron complex outermembrane receptor protein
MFDIDRVEVLKGPQGTLYGRNTTGGTMKLVTTKAEPSAGITGHVVGGVGNYEQTKIGGGINIPIVPDVLAVRLTALQDKVDDGYQDVALYDGNPLSPTASQLIGTRTNGTKDNELYRLGLTLEPSDDWRILLSYEQNESDISMANTNISRDPGPVVATIMPGAFGIPYVEPSSDFMRVALNNPNTAYSKSKTASATVEYSITDDLSTKLVYGWRDVYTEFDTDIDGTNQAFNLFAFPFEQVAEQHSIEWQLNGTAMDGALEWVTGLYWFQV